MGVGGRWWWRGRSRRNLRESTSSQWNAILLHRNRSSIHVLTQAVLLRQSLGSCDLHHWLVSLHSVPDNLSDSHRFTHYPLVHLRPTGDYNRVLYDVLYQILTTSLYPFICWYRAVKSFKYLEYHKISTLPVTSICLNQSLQAFLHFVSVHAPPASTATSSAIPACVWGRGGPGTETGTTQERAGGTCISVSLSVWFVILDACMWYSCRVLWSTG